MRTWIVVGLLTCAAVAAGWAWALSVRVPVEVGRVERGDIRAFIDEQGQTRLPQTYLITMPFDGRIEAIELVEGQAVSRGQVVARLVPLDLDLNYEEAHAAVERLTASIAENDDVSVETTSLRQAVSFVESMNRTVEAAAERVRAGKAKLEYSERVLGRVLQLRKSQAATEEAEDLARLQYVESSVSYQQDVLVKAALESIQAATALLPHLVQQYIDRKGLTRAVLEKQRAEAQVRLREAENNRQRGVLISPIDGVVLARRESNERRVAGGTVLLELGDLEQLEVEADILSQDVVRVAEGDPVELYGPAVGPRGARGRVARIFPAGFTKVSSLGVEQQRVKVIVAFEPGELARLRREQNLGVGYRVRLRILTEQKSRTLVLPRAALFRGAAGDWQVFAVRDGRARLTPIHVGLINDEHAEVLSGLQEGELVVLAPEATLSDRDRVRILNGVVETVDAQQRPGK
ncbi:MAG: HlyD family efflux transporter periplasmic adaptor subunit [Pirellulales bacterium]|nr:HlyD family efflux transporter periplasmic adaptor subunit [Pirellulales bacterium]